MDWREQNHSLEGIAAFYGLRGDGNGRRGAAADHYGPWWTRISSR